MWYAARITEAAASEPVTLAEAKRQCNVTGTDDDTTIQAMIAAARDYVERYCASRFATQTVEIKCDVFADLAHLPEAPVQSVTSIAYVDVAGSTQTVSTSVYELRADGLEAAIVLKYGQVWPSIQPGSRITVTAVVGHDVAPPSVKSAILLMVGKLYSHASSDATLRSETVEGVGSWQWGSVDVVEATTAAAIEALLVNYRVHLQ